VIRPETQARVDELHARIGKLLAREKAYYDKQHPDDNELWRSIAHTRIDFAAYSPGHRSQMAWATASFPTVGERR